MDLEQDAHRLLGQLDVLRHPSDLDLLIFFARHPRSLLSSDQLAAFLGYGVKDIAASLDLLLDAGFLTRTPNHRHAARMYVFAINPPGGGWLPALKKLASTREGRLALIWAIRRRLSQADGPTQMVARKETKSGAIPFSRRLKETRRNSIAVDKMSRESGKRSGHGGDR
jgi:hypothetical protein